MKPYTVSWEPNAQSRLAEMWLDNLASRPDVSRSADEIDRLLANCPNDVGAAFSARSRNLVVPPLSVLYSVSEDDRTVRVIYVKFWDE